MSWTVEPSEADIVRRLLLFLEGRGSLTTARLADVSVDDSVREMRKELTEALQALRDKSPAVPAIRAMRGACATYLHRTHGGDISPRIPLQEMRGVFASSIAFLSAQYEIPVHGDLAVRLAEEYRPRWLDKLQTEQYERARVLGVPQADIQPSAHIADQEPVPTEPEAVQSDNLRATEPPRVSARPSSKPRASSPDAIKGPRFEDAWPARSDPTGVTTRYFQQATFGVRLANETQSGGADQVTFPAGVYEGLGVQYWEAPLTAASLTAERNWMQLRHPSGPIALVSAALCEIIDPGDLVVLVVDMSDESS